MSPEEVQPYLDDYARATGRRSDKYVCPLTLEPCDLGELSAGHILNRDIGYADNSTVPVKKDSTDSFYGTRVETMFIKWATYANMTPLDMLMARPTFEVRFREDGPTFKAFLLDESEVEEKKKHIPVVPMKLPFGEIAWIGVRTSKDNPDAPKEGDSGKGQVSFGDSFMPSHWVASMLKAAHLTMFKLFKYRAVFDPCGDMLRRTLMQYFYDAASRDDAPNYFRPYENSVKVITETNAEFTSDEYRPYDLDTLRDQKVIAHSHAGRHFADTIMYKLTDRTICVTVPQRTTSVDVKVALELYDKLMTEDVEWKHDAVITQYVDEKWVPIGGVNYRLRDTVVFTRAGP